MTTKEQERKALDRIRKIVEELGEDSYIGTAFEGCFEIAEENIENDFACSMKQRAEAASLALETEVQTTKRLELDIRDLREAIRKTKETSAKQQSDLEKSLEDLRGKMLPMDDLIACERLAMNAEHEALQKINEAAAQIVELAESPDSEAFTSAVKTHRNARELRGNLKGLIERVRNAQGIGA